MGFLACTGGLTGKAEAKNISKGVHELGLGLSLCRYTNFMSKDTSDYTSLFILEVNVMMVQGTCTA